MGALMKNRKLSIIWLLPRQKDRVSEYSIFYKFFCTQISNTIIYKVKNTMLTEVHEKKRDVGNPMLFAMIVNFLPNPTWQVNNGHNIMIWHR